jgi:glyoxylase-like metal-dependent hydrolase (beta-lactamase superfamily II)
MAANPSGQSRRALLKTAVAGVAGIALGVPVRTLYAQQTAPGANGVERLADDLFILRLPGQENVVAQTTRDGVVLVDGGSSAAAAALTRAIAALPGGGPVTTLFNTHWHPEQTGLNEQIGKAGGTIIAHENTRLWLTTDVTWPWNGQTFKRLRMVAKPNKTLYTTGKLDSGVL